MWTRRSCLADRVLVLDQGRIALDLPVDLERPRRHADPGFAALRSRLLRELGVDEDDPASLTERPHPLRAPPPGSKAYAGHPDATARCHRDRRPACGVLIIPNRRQP